MSQGQMMKICKICPLYTFQMSSCMDARWHLTSHLMSTSHENFGVLGHARWTQGEIWKVISHAPRVRTLLLDVTSLMSQGQMMKICKIFPLYTFQMSSQVDMRWDLKTHLVSTLRENFGVLGHARWMQGEIWKVISCAPRMRTFPLYTFQMSSHMDARWHLKSHFASTSHENFGMVEQTLGHTRWTWGEIWKVILCAPHVRTLVWWRGHLVTLDGCVVRFESHLMCTLHENFGGGGDTWSRWMDASRDLRSHLACTSCENFAIRCYLFDVPRPNEEDLQEFPLIYLSNVISHGCEVTFEKSSHIHLTWEF